MSFLTVLIPRLRSQVSPRSLSICTTGDRCYLGTNVLDEAIHDPDVRISDFEVHEVFSRGQHPQHWHIAKRGLGTDQDGNVVDGEAFMEVARKETTLTDVENELAGVIRRFLD